MYHFDPLRSVRHTILAGAFLASTLTLFASAGASASALLNVDLPTPHTIVANGEMLDIGGWTAGSRIDVYLDGPAGFGEGIGSTLVYASRPDVELATGDVDMADSGFNLAWQPMDLTAGPHTLYVYSLVDGSWIFETVPIIGLGNFVVPADRGNNDRDDGTFDMAPSVGPADVVGPDAPPAAAE